MNFPNSFTQLRPPITMNAIQSNICRVTRPLAIALGAWFCLAGMSHANSLRALTSKDGRTLSARIVSKTGNSVQVIRTADSRRFNIPFETLSQEDQLFLTTWQPPTSQWTRSSAAMRPSSYTQARRPYTGPIFYNRSRTRSYRPSGYVIWTNHCAGRTIVRRVSAPCRK